MLSRRTLLQSLASLFPLSALGLGRAPTQPDPRLPEPPGGAKAWGEALRREVERPSGLPGLFRDCSGPPGSGKAIIVHTTVDPDCTQRFMVNGEPVTIHTPTLSPAFLEHQRELNKHFADRLDELMFRHLKGGAG